MNDMSDPVRDDQKRLLGRVRKARIAEMIRARGFMSSSEIAAEFGVSEMTVRRDLAELDLQGELMRTHGGAVTREEQTPGASDAEEPLFDDRNRHNHNAKLRIAATAERMIAKGSSVALDVGTTTYQLAVCLAARNDVRVFTNNLRIAALLGAHSVEIYMLGGRVRHNEMSLCGPVAVQQARKLRFDTAFIGVSSLSTAGIFDYSIEETELKRIFLEQATHKVVLCDSSKFGKVSLVQVAQLDEFDTLITDAAPPPELADVLKANGVSVIVAPD